MIKEKIIKIFKDNYLEEIYQIGWFDPDDKDFTINGSYVYFQLGNKYLCFKAVESYSKLEISITNSVIYRESAEDLIDGHIMISDFIFKNPMESSEERRILEVTFYNPEEYKNKLLSDVLLIKFSNGEYIFMDPGFLEIKIGNLNNKRFWEENTIYKTVLNIEKIRLNMK